MNFLNTCYETTNSLRLLSSYAHLLPAGIMLALGLFILIRQRNSLNNSFFTFLIYFIVWFIGDWVVWVSNDYHMVNAGWSVLDYVDIVGFVGAVYFFSVFSRGSDMRPIYKIGLASLTLYPLFLVLTGQAIQGFKHSLCESIENPNLTLYRFGVEIFSLLLISFIAIREWHKGNIDHKRSYTLITLSLVLFLSIFSLSGYISSQTSIYEIQLYGMFVLPIFVLLIIFTISKYDIFSLRFWNQQLLAWVLLPLVASQFFFLRDTTNAVLNTITLIISFVVVYLLDQNIKKENRYRIEIENLNINLEEANRRQEGLIHFISHEIKGYLAKNEAAFAGILEGDYGKVSTDLSALADTALKDTRKGVMTVMDILSASNLKKGTIKFNMQPFDLRDSILSVINDQKQAAEVKGLNLISNIGGETLTVKGDSNEIASHVLRNLIDNAIKYTPKGKIEISLMRQGDKALLSVKDSGIGITEEDKKNLFTEGGRGKEAIKTNVSSTGYGLFIAKQIVDAHRGRMWAESEGQGKGSTFYVELPI